MAVCAGLEAWVVEELEASAGIGYVGGLVGREVGEVNDDMSLT